MALMAAASSCLPTWFASAGANSRILLIILLFYALEAASSGQSTARSMSATVAESSTGQTCQISWVIVTGGGSGIGRGLVHHFCKTNPVLTCGRRKKSLEETQRSAPYPENVHIVASDVGTAGGRSALLAALPAEAPTHLLVQNAAIGDPDPVTELDISHFEEALRVNVVAPLALTQALLPRLKAGGGRILHLGTSVAHNPQRGTTTYGVTKAAFHRLYKQLNAEDIGVPVGSLSPGLVDTEGVRDHVKKARDLGLDHVQYFDQAFDNGWTTDMNELLRFVDEILAKDPSIFTEKEWRFSEWRKECDSIEKQLGG